MAYITIHNEVSDRPIGHDEWCLCFQRCTYNYDDGTTDDGFRFIWRRPNTNLQAARGQARIPDAATLYKLINKAHAKGWF
jgi:hypothetical protein